jgi:hypothetical protein
MFGAGQRERWQVEDLTAFKVNRRLVGEVFAAVVALLQGMNYGVLGIVTELQGASGMTGLSAGFAPGLFAQAFGPGLLGPVRGRRA